MFTLSKNESEGAINAEVKMAESYDHLAQLIPHVYPQRLGAIFQNHKANDLRELWEVADKLDISRATDSIELTLRLSYVPAQF